MISNTVSEISELFFSQHNIVLSFMMDRKLSYIMIFCVRFWINHFVEYTINWNYVSHKHVR